MINRAYLLLLPVALLAMVGLAWAAVLPGDEIVLEPGLTTTSTPVLTDFGYLPVALGEQTGPSTTATLPPPSLTPFVTLTPTTIPGPGTPIVTPTATATTDAPSPTATLAATVTPTSTPAATSLPVTPTATTEPLNVSVAPNYTVYDDGRGRLRIIGELANDSKVMIRSLSVTASLFGGDGGLLDSTYAPIQLDHLPHGDRTCFVMTFEQATGWANIRFDPPKYVTDVDTIPDLRVRKVATAYDPIMGWYTITGQVRNRQDEPAELVQLVGSLYDRDGRITGCAFAFVGNTNLLGQQRGDFEMLFTGGDYKDVAEYKIQVEGRSE